MCLLVQARPNGGPLGHRSHFLLRVFLEVSYSNSFLIALEFHVEMGIIRLRKSSAGWPTVPAAREEHYVGLRCLHGSLVFSSSYGATVIREKGVDSLSWKACSLVKFA